MLIFPTLIGLTLILAAFRLLLWAFNTLDAVRGERTAAIGSFVNAVPTSARRRIVHYLLMTDENSSSFLK